jgi:molecular chaperone DnaJ
MSSNRDFYDILGIGREASAEEVKKAFRQQAMQYHPDRNPGDGEAETRFKEAAEAYEVLGDAEKRRLYDTYGRAGLKGTDYHDFTSVEDIFSAFGGMFGDLFGFGRARREPDRGSDLKYDLTVSFRESVKGARKEITIPKPEVCADCTGTGVDPAHPPEICPDCRGRGQVIRQQGFLTISTTCRKCRGNGKVVTHHCSCCKGEGLLPGEKKLTITLPAGIDNGNRLRLRGEGMPGARGGAPGDLYLDITVREHPHFRRHGEDILLAYPVTVAQAALGDELEIPTLDGSRTLDLPAGTQTHSLFRIKGEGVDVGRRIGDLVVQVLVQTPDDLGREEKKLFRKLRELEQKREKVPWWREDGKGEA